MELPTALIVYTAAFISVVALCIQQGTHISSAIIAAIIVCQVLLNLMVPMYHVHNLGVNSWQAIYYTIQLLSPLIVYVYATVKVWRDRGSVSSFQNAVGKIFAN